MKNWIQRRNLRLVEIQREGLPRAFHVQSVKERKQDRDHPGCGPHKSLGRDLHRLIVYNDGPFLQCVRSEMTFEQPKSSSQQKRSREQESEKQTKLQFEDVPIDR